MEDCLVGSFYGVSGALGVIYCLLRGVAVSEALLRADMSSVWHWIRAQIGHLLRCVRGDGSLASWAVLVLDGIYT